VSTAETAINAVRLAIATAEALSSAMDTAKKALDSSAEQLKDVLADIEKDQGAMHETLAKDRKEADDTFDKKFDGSKDDH
jgi:septal ring factor EnvC (AmiA/AmiB activator)